MTIEIDNYKVEIKVKAVYSEKANKEDTMNLLNSISIWAFEAANEYDRTGAHALAKRARKASREIYKILETKGCYKDC